MARTEQRGARGARDDKPAGPPTGPAVDPEDDIFEADQKGLIKPLRPNKAWLKKNTEED